jgi:hypothetical protein
LNLTCAYGILITNVRLEPETAVVYIDKRKERRVSLLQPNHYLRAWIFLVLLCCSACTSIQEPVEPPQHYFDKTEVDLEYGRPEAAARYQRPRGVQQYTSDGTEVDLAQPRAASPEEGSPAATPPASNTSPKAPLPGGDR